MDYEIRYEQGVQIVELNGSLDMNSAKEARMVLRESVQTLPELLLIDLSGLRYLKSTGYQSLYELAGRARELKTPVAIVGPPPEIATIMRIFRLTDLFPVYESVSEAVEEMLPLPIEEGGFSNPPRV